MKGKVAGALGRKGYLCGSQEKGNFHIWWKRNKFKSHRWSYAGQSIRKMYENISHGAPNWDFVTSHFIMGPNLSSVNKIFVAEVSTTFLHFSL